LASHSYSPSNLCYNVTMKYAKELAEAKRIATAAGEIILQYFDGEQDLQRKDDDSPVTKADILVNELVISELERSFPEDGIIGEEKSTTEYGLGRKWLCDPIDGTVGFVWGTPTAMFSLALVVDGKPVVGVVYDTFLKRMYEGVVGQGSFCNGVQLKVSDKELAGGHVAITASVTKIRNLTYVAELQKAGAHLPIFSGAVYKSSLVAKGKFEGYIEAGVGAHDMAAVQVIVEEAGGKITGQDGKELDYSKPFKGAIVSNGTVHQKLVEIVNC
jgi:fructose-1,6-bisphosphatase/inositol monophosphatase family enzyme